MKYEGHFLLWYLILMPFAKFGFPYITTNIISWGITCISVWLILYKAPFKFYKRVLLILTVPFLYLYPVISRCYCLIPLAITCMCIFYKDRNQKPFRYLLSIILLANTHIIMYGMVGVVLLEYIYEMVKDWKKYTKEENNKKLISFIIAIIILLICILPLLGSLNTNKDLGGTANLIQKLLLAIFYNPCLMIMQMYNCFSGSIIVMSTLTILTIIVLFYEINKSKLNCLKIFLIILFQSLIYTFIYSSSNQKVATVIFIILFFKWTSIYKHTKKTIGKKDNVVNMCLVILTVINILNGMINIFYEIKYNYSNAYEVGDYINLNIEDKAVILNGSRVEFASSIIPYVKKDIKFYHIQGNRYFTYAIWDEANKTELNIEDIKNLNKIFNNKQKLYYIYCINKFDIQDADDYISEKNIIDEYVKKGVFTQIYATNNESIKSEDYILYEVNINY